MIILRRTVSVMVAFAASVLLAIALPTTPGSAQSLSTPANREQITLSFAPVVKRAAPAVVNVFTKKVVREQAMGPLFDDPIFRRFFGGESPFGAPRERVQNSLGSGVIVAADGLVVTNHHVIKGSDQITVVLADRREFEATLVNDDERTDIALLRIKVRGEKLPYLELRDSDELEVGDLVLAIGNPFGVGQTVTSGIVSALARTAAGISDYNFFIQTDAAINPGNSGGALVTMDGHLAGINTAIYSRSGGSIGIGFAIPANMVRAVLNAAAGGSGTKVVRPWLGVSVQPVTADIAASLGMDRPTGVLINGIDPRGPGNEAGLKKGDVLLSVNGQPVDNPEALRFRVATQQVGKRATLEISRRGQRSEVSLPLIAPPETPARETTPIRGANPFSGVIVANLSPALAEEIGFIGTAQGVVVLEAVRGSPAAEIGLRPGDVLLRLNDRELGTVRDLVSAVRQSLRSWSISIRRGDQVLNTTVRG
ncbi:putative periplasmic serine endoprotease DegP-like [uncultured Gammaproteobacteria bacterium]